MRTLSRETLSFVISTDTRLRLHDRLLSYKRAKQSSAQLENTRSLLSNISSAIAINGLETLHPRYKICAGMDDIGKSQMMDLKYDTACSGLSMIRDPIIKRYRAIHSEHDLQSNTVRKLNVILTFLRAGRLRRDPILSCGIRNARTYLDVDDSATTS